MADSDPSGRRKAGISGWLGAGLLLLSLALLAAGLGLFHVYAPNVALVHLQWAGSATTANRIVHPAAYGQYRVALYWDLAGLIPGFTLGLIAASYLGWRVFWTHRMQRAAVAAIWAAAVAGLCNVAQDVVLLSVLRHRPMHGVWPFRVAAALSFVKFSVLLVTAVIGLIALGTTAGRLVLHRRTRARWDKMAKELGGPAAEPADFAFAPVPGKLHEPAKRELSPEPLWAKAKDPGVVDSYWVQASTFPSDPDKNQVGICLSGGGIRSATVALGALQTLQEPTSPADGKGRSELARARYLVSVSGGGYTAAAYQLALHASKGSGAGTGPPKVFAPGSAEEDHLRRHSSYIADTAGQWVSALGVLFRCVATGIVLIGLTITALGLAIGRFYRDIPIVTGGLAKLRPLFLTHPQPGKLLAHATALAHARTAKAKPLPAPGWPVIPWGVTLAVLTVLALAVVAYLAQLSLSSLSGRSARRTAAAGRYLIGLTGLLVALGVAVPALVWLSSWLTWKIHFSHGPAITTGTITGIVTYFGALIATLWKKRTTLTKTTGSVRAFFSKSPGGQVLPNSMTQMLLLWLCLLVLILAAVLASGWVATSGLDDSWWALLPIGLLLFAAIFVDETWLSLHNFYRRRLVSAFTIPGPKGNTPNASQQSHRPLRHRPDRPEKTPLSTHAMRPASGTPPEHCFPEVKFAATANVTGQDRTPPGRRAVPYMLASEHIGGPQVGWVTTSYLEKLVASPIKRDLDVTAARAISGAAFAAAMGSQTRFYEVFLALANVRLGTWLPNPWFVALKSQHLEDWTVPDLPSRRRLSLLAREIFGIHPSQARMLLCTDGGHYDNLGLLELLRLRCGLIYCFDASGGGATLADTLAGTLAVAREELGVDIALTNSFSLVPGGMSPPVFDSAGPLARLNARISNSAVITGDITYPEDPPGTPPAKLIFAQAALTKDLPYQVLEYSQNDAGFPRDSTADQWFNSQQFDAYQQLGRYLGQQAMKAAKPETETPRRHWWRRLQATNGRISV